MINHSYSFLSLDQRFVVHCKDIIAGGGEDWNWTEAHYLEHIGQSGGNYLLAALGCINNAVTLDS